MINWKVVSIGDLCTKVTDGSHYSPLEVSDGYPMFSVKDMSDNAFEYSAVKRISKEDYIRLKKGDCQPKKGDVLIAKDGSYLKHVFVCREEKEEVILSSIAILRPDIEKLDSDYFMHLLRTASVKGMMESFVSGSALPRIVLRDFKKMKVTIPVIADQKRIASILSAYDDLIEVNKQRIKVLEETARELYKEWFGRMRFPGYKEAKFRKGMPESWNIRKVEDTFQILGGGTPSTKQSDYWNGNINWFTPTDITGSGGIFLFEAEKKITKLGLTKSSAKEFPPYSIMMTSRATIGAVGINTESACANQGFIICLPNKTVPFTFLYFWITFNKEIFEMLGTGSTFLEISKGTFKKIKMLLPNSELMNLFHSVIEPLFKQTEILLRQNQEIRTIRDRLLPRLISGKLIIKDSQSYNQNRHG